MTIEEVIKHVEEGYNVFIGTGGRKRIVINAGWAWIEYQVPSQPNSIVCQFTEKFAKWAKDVEKEKSA